jgi:chemosensory pili system protein ChpA (sensor histidine kinase/response regulator)
MGDNRNFTALDWVTGEINETLMQARQALEAYISNPEDATQIRFCLTYLHQVHGILQMVEFHGGALLAEELERLAQALLDGKAANAQDAYEILMRAILQLPVYLERVKVTRRDDPASLLPLLNDLRAVRGGTLLTETALFSPDMSAARDIQSSRPRISDEKFLESAKKLRKLYQATLVGIFKDRDFDNNLPKLEKVFSGFEKLSRGTRYQPLWLVSLALVEGLGTDSISANVAISNLLREIEKLVKYISNNGKVALEHFESEELIKNLLYYVAGSRGDSPRVTAVKELFKLDAALPKTETPNEDGTRMLGVDSEAMHSVLVALHDEFARIKNVLQACASGEEHHDALRKILPAFKQAADTLAVLGLGGLRKNIEKLFDELNEVVSANQQLSTDLSATIVAKLQDIEKTLDHQFNRDSTRGDSSSALAGRETILFECQNNLEQAKDAIVEYIASQWNRQHIVPLPALLGEIRNSLETIGQRRSARILGACARYIKDKLIDSRHTPDWREMDTLADAIAGVEYYLETLDEDVIEDEDSVLAVAEESVANLGYAVAVQRRIDTTQPASGELIVDVSAPEHPERKKLTREKLTAIIAEDEQVTAKDAKAGIEVSRPPGQKEVVVASLRDDKPLLTDEEFNRIAAHEEIGKGSPPVAVEEDPGELVFDDFVTDFDDEIAEIFIEEMQEVLANIHKFYPQWKESEFKNSAAMTEFRRGFHTMKGSGRMAKARSAGELAWAIENMLNRVIDGTILPSAALCELIERVLAKLPGMMEAFGKRLPDPDSRLSRRYRLIGEALSKGETPLPFELAAPAVAKHVAQVPMLDKEPVHAEWVEVASSRELPTEEQPDWDLWEIFVAEAESHLDAVDEWIAYALSRSPLPVDATDPLQRALHTLKGSAYMAGVKVIGDLATPLEKFVKALRAFQIAAGDDFTQLLMECVAEIRDGLKQIRNRTTVDLPNAASLLQHINAMRLSLTGESEDDIAAELAGQRKAAVVSGVDLVRWTEFLAGEMAALMDADRLLAAWQDNGETEGLSRLCSELEKMAAAAEPAGLLPVASLAQLLLRSYHKSIDAGNAGREQLLPIAHEAHEALINFIDELVGGQDIAQRTELESRLRAFVATDLPARVEAATVAVIEPALVMAVEEHAPAGEASVAAMPSTGAEWVNPADFDLELLGIFVEEATELLDELEAVIGNWNDNPEDKSFVDALKRNLHTYKGGARMAGLSVLGTLAHDLETRLETFRGVASSALFNEIYDYQGRLIQGTERARQLLRGESVSFNDLAMDATHAETVIRPAVTLDIVTQPVSGKVATQTEEVPAWVEPVSAVKVAAIPAPVEPVAIAGEMLEYSSDIDRDLLGIFIEEASELVEQLDADIADWQKEPEQRSYIDSLKRTLHTLKGGARMSGMTGLGSVAHDLETYLETFAGVGNAALFDMLHDYQDKIIHGVEQARVLAAGEVAAPALVVEERAPAVPEATPVVQQPVQPAPPVEVARTPEPVEKTTRFDAEREKEQEAIEASRPAATLLSFHATQMPKGLDADADRRATAAQTAKDTSLQQETVKIPAELVDELVNLAGETSISRGRVEQQVLDFALTLGDVESTIKRMQDLLRRLEIETEAQVQSRIEEFQLRKDDFDPLEMDRYSTLQQLTRSLMETSSDLIDLRSQLNNKARETEMILLQQSRINTELQEGLMRSRMVPFSRMVPRLRRIVRQVSSELKKEVDFDLVNIEGEMDRTVLERMVAPLEHMLRNALDHGIEMPALREQAGKSRRGIVVLSFGREGGDVVITLKDDGSGIPVEKVRRKAVEKGLIAEDTQLNDREILQFIMQAGFSTAEKVTQISGRGVGMDVVHSEIKQLGGSVSINSRSGQGTEFVVRLPFTVSVNRALMVKIGDDQYAVPLNSIEGIVRISPADLRNYYQGKDTRFGYSGVKYEVRYLGEMLNTRIHPSLEGLSLPEPVILVRGVEHAMALHVDQLLGSREIVVKGLGPQFAGVPGLSGATILGDGSVLVILDLMALVRLTIVNESRRVRLLQLEQQRIQAAQKKDTFTVMVVDDSVTVRKVTSRLLEREGFEVVLAKDGADAMLQLQDMIPDIMLLDIEMPRMDGFEVATSVKNTERLKGIPIIMITSRTGEKHRERAMSIGVERYMGKPFVEDVLLQNINELLAEKVYRSAGAAE